MMAHNVYEVTFRFRVHEDNDTDLRKNIEDGGGEHNISTITNRIESRSPKGLNAPHELLDELSIAKDVEVHDLITIKPVTRVLLSERMSHEGSKETIGCHQGG